MKLFASIEAWACRRSAFLNRPRTALYLCWLVPMLFGLLSLALGQDDNWDLRNYHLYSVHALLNGKVGVDMGPARFQGYFNPVQDIPYYLMTQYLLGPVTGFVYGWLHGWNFVLLWAIGRQLLPAAQPRTVLLLALAGSCGPAFLGEIGNSMGDNMTSLLVLGALYAVLRQWDTLLHWGRRAALAAAGAGVLMGLGLGLKLTNVTFAVALCLAFFAVPLAFWQRVRLAFVFGLGVLAGLFTTGGYWFLKMWQVFGNPLFPQFNNLFHSPLALEKGVIDTYFRPKNLSETLLWPFVFTRNMARVVEIPLSQLIWPVAYVAVLALCVACLLRRTGVLAARPPLPARSRFVLLFFSVAYLAWMELFSIYRYLVPVELLAPLMVWLCLQGLLPERTAGRLGGWVLLVTSLSVFPFTSFGHMGWAERSFSAEVPALAQPAQTVVFIAQPHPPLAWLATFYPKEVAFVGLGTGFPESPQYRERMRALMTGRTGPHYLMLSGARNPKTSGLQRKRAVADALGLTATPHACARLDALLRRVRFQVDMRPLPAGGCTLELQARYQLDLAAMDLATEAEAAQQARQYGVEMEPGSCRKYGAAVGAEPYPYRLCRVRVVP